MPLRLAGGIPVGNFGRCMPSIPCGWTILKPRGPRKISSVLDVGCGGGLLTEAMAARGANVTGIDMSEAPLGWPGCTSRNSGSKWITAKYRRGIGGGNARQLRYGDLHGNARARAGTRLHRKRLCHVGASRRPDILFHTEPQCQILPPGHRRRRISAASHSARHP